MELSRKDRAQTSGKKAGKKGVKATVAAVGFTVLFGTGVVFGATDFGALITNYAANLLGFEKAAINEIDTAQEEAELNTHLKNAHDKIDHAITSKGTGEAVRVELEISKELERIKGEVTAVEQEEIQKANTELENTANNKIQEAKDAFEAIAQQYFQATETPAQ